MFSCWLVCLSVCLSFNKILKNLLISVHEIFGSDRHWDKEQGTINYTLGVIPFLSKSRNIIPSSPICSMSNSTTLLLLIIRS